MSDQHPDGIRSIFDDVDHQALQLEAHPHLIWSLERVAHLLKSHPSRPSWNTDDREAVRLIRHLASTLRGAHTRNQAIDKAREGI
ncbi:MAG: hypothetical protein ACE366_03395 [Bradymonadia bacterium]